MKHSYVSISVISEWFGTVSPNKVQKSSLWDYIKVENGKVDYPAFPSQMSKRIGGRGGWYILLTMH